MKKLLNLSLIAAVATLAGACGGDSDNGMGPNGGTPGQVSLSFTSRAAGALPAPAFSLFSAVMDTLVSVGDTLIIDSAKVVLREIELKRVEVVDCDIEPEPEGCEKFETGPLLVDVPLNGMTEQQISISIDPGTYDELEFDIHKVSNDDPEDAVFRAAHPDMIDKSIVVWGSFNGQDFAYETDLNEEQEFDLNPPLVIDETTITTTNVTVRLDISQWFTDGFGGLIDPATANKGGANENLVKDNIRNSIEAFEDEDRDGDDSDES